MARKKEQVLQAADPKAVQRFREGAKKKGGRTIEQLPIHAWGDLEIGHVLSGDFVAIREGRAKAGSTMKPGFLFDLVESETGELQTWGCPAVLKQRLEQALVQKGDSIEVMLTGQLPAKAGNNPAWDFALNHYPKAE